MLTVTEKIKDLLKNKQEVLLQADGSTNNKENGICFDGIVDETCFNKQLKKVFFCLKKQTEMMIKGENRKAIMSGTIEVGYNINRQITNLEMIRTARNFIIKHL